MALDPKRSIKPWIPQTRLTDPDNFPAYEYKPYPRMMTQLCTEAYLKDWMEHNSHTENGRTSYKGGRPVIGSPVPILDAARQSIIVNDAEEEAAFLKANPPAENVARVEIPAATLSTATHAAEMAAKEKEIEALKAQLQPEKKKGGWPAGRPRKPLPENLSAE